jgi:hypothetical protein
MPLILEILSVRNIKLIFSAEADFSVHPVEMAVLDDDVQNNRGSALYEFMVDIAINNDNIQEPEEYFLVVLDVKDFDAEKRLEIDSSKQCARIRIKKDNSGK